MTRFSLSHRGVTVAVLAVITIGFMSQLPSLSTETGYRAYLGEDHPTIETLESFIEGFGGGLPMAAVWSCRDTDQCESVFDPRSLEMANAVVQELRNRGDIVRIESPATTPILIANGDEIGARTLLGATDIDALAARAVIDPLWRGTLVSTNGEAGAIFLELASSSSEDSKAVLRALEAALAPFEAAGFRFYIVGQTAQFAITDEALAADSARLTVPMIILVSIVILFLFRSWQAVAGALATVGLSTLWTLGLLAALGWPQNSINQTIAPLVLVMALSDAIHLLVRYRQAQGAISARTRTERADAMIRGAKDAWAPCLVTTLTTAAGFASFATSSLESFMRFGLICAAGIVGALILTFTVLPIVMIWLPPDKLRTSQAPEMWDRILTILVEGTRRHAKYIVAVSMVLFVVLGIGAIQLRVDIDEYKLYGEDSEVVKGFRFLEANLRKPDSVELEISLPPDAELFNAPTMAALGTLTESLNAIDGLGPVHSVLDVLAWTNRILNQDDPAFDRLGRSDGENAELLTMLSMKDPAALDRWLSPDYRRLRFSVEADKRPQSERGEILAQVEEAIERDLGSGWGSQITGSFAVYYDLTRDMQRTQISSFAVVILIVFVILAVYLRTLGGTVRAALGWAVAGMFPTILPIIATFGVMGYAGINLDMGTAMVAAILIGIAVDDTVHLLGEFYRRREQGSSPVPAIEGAVLHVGQAIVTTSAALAAGFFILTVSSWQSIASFGFLSGIAIIGALAADLWILPAIILLWNRKGIPDLPQEDSAAEFSDSTARKVGLSAIVVLALGFELLVAAWALSGPEDSRHLACRTMPNGVVPVVTATTSLCNLEPFDRVIAAYAADEPVFVASREAFLETVRSSRHSVMLEIERDGMRSKRSVPVVVKSYQDRLQLLLVSLLLVSIAMTFVLRVYWHSKARAAPAMVILFAVMCGEVVSIICSPAGDALELITAPIAPFIAASLTHMALTFPRERQLVREFPAIVSIPYLFAGGLAAVELRGFHFDPAFWALCVRFMMAFATGGMILLGVNAYRVMSESQAPVDRARSRMLFAAFLGVPLILFPVLFGSGRSLPGGQITVMLIGCALFVLPLGYSITRYDLFDFPATVRSSIDTGLEMIAMGIFTAVGIALLQQFLGVSGPVSWAGGAIIGYAGAVRFRGRLVAYVEARLPRSATLRGNLIEDYGAELISEDASANLLGRSLESGLETSGVAVFLEMDQSFRPAYASREGLGFRSSLARAGVAALSSGNSSLNLAHADLPDTPEISTLRECDVALVLPIADVGVVLVGPPAQRMAYRRDEVESAERLARHAAMALHLARDAAKRLTQERRQAVAHRTTELAHEIGSRLTVLESRAGRIIEHAGESGYVTRESTKIETTAKYLGRTLRRMAREAQFVLQGPTDAMNVSDVVSAAMAAVGPDKPILLSLAPDLPVVHHSEELIRVIVNLLENAIEASGNGASIWLFATSNETEITIEIRDEGVGMAPTVLERACEVSFTTRRDQGGMGFGLSLCAEIIEDRGGKLAIESSEGHGTTVVVTFPC